MNPSPKVSLVSAILINLNIMVGTGVFVNTVVLARNAGIYGSLAYLIVSLLLLPLIMTFARLLKYHKGGTVYDFGASTSTILGFVSGWSYFVAKLASASVGIHVFSTLLKQLIPLLQSVSTLTLDALVITFFMLLNALNMRIGQAIQYTFFSLKCIPILFALSVGLYFFMGSPPGYEPFALNGILTSLPFVVFAFTGFEACCSISGSLEDPERNGPRALLISFFLGVILVTLYQLMFYGALGSKLALLSSFDDAFPMLLSRLIEPGTKVYQAILVILNIGIAMSSLGAAYSIVYSNAWNLFTLGQQKHTFAAKYITLLNRHHAPLIAILIEGSIILSYLLIFNGNLIPLQQVSSLGMIITYCISTIALAVLMCKRRQLPIIPVLSALSCMVLMYGFRDNVRVYGSMPLIFFGVLLLLGLTMFTLTKKNQS